MLPSVHRLRLSVLAGLFLGLTLAPGGCSRQPKDDRPNIIWIVWDTVRADRMTLYGHDKPTTPFLDRWARGARVFDNCVSISATTVPSHASMFTGLLPTEHGLDNIHCSLADGFTTVAELLGESGYRTYLFAANPYISKEFNFAQGFDRAEKPTDPQYFQDALRITRSKINPQDRSHNLAHRIQAVLDGKDGAWPLKACGELAQRGLEEWLADSDSDRPFFAFLNYMEAHRPYIPAETYRRRMMTPQQVEASYQVDRTWDPIWAYTFGLGDYSRQDLELTAATYDASLAELDALLEKLLTSLESAGRLDNTVVILTADHGEQLGEHHMLDHQYSLYQPLLDVPLVIHYPQAFEPGRDDRPVMNLDLFATVLELAGLDPPEGSAQSGVSLTAPSEDRTRLAEYPMPLKRPIENLSAKHPEWDSSRWQRKLRAWYDQPYKYIWASDDRHELYDLAADPRELHNLAIRQPDLARRLQSELNQAVEGLAQPPVRGPARSTMPEDLERQLRSLGYGGDGDTENDESTKPKPPTTQPTPPTSTTGTETP